MLGGRYKENKKCCERITREIRGDIEKWKLTELQNNITPKSKILIQASMKAKKPEHIGQALNSNLSEY